MTGKDTNGSHPISDTLWERIETLLLPENPMPKGGRPRMDSRKAMEAILYVLRAGCKWEDLPSTVHCRFQEWRKTGVFDRMWQTDILTYDELRTLNWHDRQRMKS